MLLTLAEATAATGGGKAGALGALVRAGLPVPPGVVVPLDVHRAALAGRDLDDVARREGPGAAARLIHSRPLPSGLREELGAALPALGGVVAVRSSSTGEDTTADSGAGQHDTFLAVEGVDAVADRVRACWASLWSDRAVAYRAARGWTGEGATAVIVQRHVDADVSGVLFTADPGSPDGVAVVEASWGLGPSVVEGLVDPDTSVVARGRVVERSVGAKATRVDRGPGGPVTSEVPAGSRDRACLADDVVERLVALGERAAAVLGGRVDVEWAVEGDAVWLLQARPVTAELPVRRGARVRDGDAARADPAEADPLVGTLRGTPGSAGRATGPVRLVHGPDDFAAVRPADVLVCRFTDPAWTPLFGVVAAVVTETGGLLSHAAIVAREHRLPAVLGVPGVLAALRDGETVTVDGGAGSVHRHAP